MATSYHNVVIIYHSPPDESIAKPLWEIIVNVYKNKFIVNCINSLAAPPILACNLNDLDRDQPIILVFYALPVFHMMQTYRMTIKASKIFKINNRKMHQVVKSSCNWMTHEACWVLVQNSVLRLVTRDSDPLNYHQYSDFIG